MDKYEIVRKIENFAPPELAEDWDCSGWIVDNTEILEISKIMFCLTVTDDIIQQATTQKCDMIISHHPLFFVPFEWKNINLYSAHTNMDKTDGGTTDVLINKLGLKTTISDGFIRYTDCEIAVDDFLKKLCIISPDLRYVNNREIKDLHKIAFCAGSGMEFIKEAEDSGADAFVSGDLKFHTALDSRIVVFDIGHFESEIFILKTFSDIVGNDVNKVIAAEKSPFKQNKY